jgi:glutamine---fructose-6-phosphate transaminase (isomerizing)
MGEGLQVASSSVPGASHMRTTMAGQPQALAALLRDDGEVAGVAARLAGRRVVVVGTGTSWHAANQTAAFLRLAGLDAAAQQSSDAVLDGRLAGDVLVALTHTGSRKRYTAQAVHEARAAGLDVVQVSGTEVAEADLHTVARERSAAYTASHTATLLRMAQVAAALGAELALEGIPAAVQAALDAERPAFAPPERLLEYCGGGINAWTAAEGALKVREAAYVASEGLGVEQLLHGPMVALRDRDHLVCLDGGGPWSARVAEIAAAAEASGTPVTRIAATGLGEPLSVFALTAAVQRIALESAEALGTDPDTFGRDVPGREAWERITL